LGVIVETSDSYKGRIRIRDSISCAPTTPPPVPPPPRRLERRCGGRHFFHDRRVDRNGARTRSTSNRKPSRQAKKEECDSPRRIFAQSNSRFGCRSTNSLIRLVFLYTWGEAVSLYVCAHAGAREIIREFDAWTSSRPINDKRRCGER